MNYGDRTFVILAAALVGTAIVVVSAFLLDHWKADGQAPRSSVSSTRFVPQPGSSALAPPANDAGALNELHDGAATASTTLAAPSVEATKRSAWAQAYAELLPLAKARDRDAASALYRRTYECLTYVDARRFAKEIGLDPSVGPGSSSQAISSLEQQLAAVDRVLAAGAESCADVDATVLLNALHEVILLAALVDNPSAVCTYVSGGPFSNSRLGRDAQEAARAGYLHNALSIAKKGIQDGNWGVVHQLAYAYSQHPSARDRGVWLSEIVEPDPETAYMYVLLEMHGADNEYAMKLNSILIGMRDTYDFTQDEIDSATFHAQQLYDKYFYNKPYQRDDTYGTCVPPGVLSTPRDLH